MNEGLIPGRYAKALYKVADERNCAERMYELMHTLSRQLILCSDIQSVISNPFVSDSDKTQLIITAAGATDSDTTFRDFLKLLETKHRIGFLSHIALAYETIYRKQNDIHRVEVVSAAPLDKTVEDRIKALVQKQLKGAKMEYESVIDPSIIGGFIINIDNERLDASLDTQLKEIRQNLIK